MRFLITWQEKHAYELEAETEDQAIKLATSQEKEITILNTNSIQIYKIEENERD